MKVLHVSPAFAPAFSYGGPIRSLESLCRALAALNDCEVRVLTTDADGPLVVSHEAIAACNYPFSVTYASRIWGTFSLALIGNAMREVQWADVVHLTGVFSSPTPLILLLCRVMGKPLIWSPRGSLNSWRDIRKPVLKKIWVRTCAELLNPRRTYLHVTSKSEAEDVSERLSGTGSIVTIPNTIDIDIPLASPSVSDTFRITFLGRLDPIKNVESLIRAARNFSSISSRWILQIAGAGSERYEQLLRRLVYECNVEEHVKFLGNVNETEKGTLFSATDVLVLPSHRENFGMVILEALLHEIPVVAAHGTPWKIVEEIGCGYWTGNDDKSLTAALVKVFQGDRRGMGRIGRQFVLDTFTPGAVAKSMYEVYIAAQSTAKRL